MTVYNSGMKPKWRIDEFAQVVKEALEASGYQGPCSGRVRAVPDPRTIRYYTTLGLLDRPEEFRGRVAYYGPRHVLQLAAIKQLQAQGASLQQVQEQLAGADEERLQQWARIPEQFWRRWERSARLAAPSRKAPRAGAPAEQEESGEREPRFWEQPPRALHRSDAEPETVPETGREEFPLSPAVQFRIAPGVTLLLEGVDAERLTPRVRWGLRAELQRLRRRLAELGLLDATNVPSQPS